jgi:hypothetical protein
MLNTNTRISHPILQPDNEIGQCNGFAVTRRGIVHQSSAFTKRINGGYQRWMGTQQ